MRRPAPPASTAPTGGAGVGAAAMDGRDPTSCRRRVPGLLSWSAYGRPDGRSPLAALLPLLVAGPRSPGPLRGHPSHRPRDRRARRGRRRAAGGRRAVPGVHARPAAPHVRQWPGRAGRGPLGADDRRHAVGRLLHGHRRRRRRRDMLRPRGRRRALLRRVRRPRHARVLHARAPPQARGRQPHRRPPARRALRALDRGGHRGPRGGRARPAGDHLAGRGVPAARRGRRPPLSDARTGPSLDQGTANLQKQALRAEQIGGMEAIARILVAEDSALLRRMIGDVLRANGWEVLEAADGQTALAAARAENPAVLLMAREMEGLDGLAVLDALRGDPRTAGMPVVFVTGHTEAHDLAEGLERGAHDYVRKPVDPIELVARIRAALRLRALHDELARRNAELEQLARTDVLTGLANRRHADDVLRATIASARRHGRTLSAVLVDVDRFKAINDAHGHAAGDAVLREIAVRLAAGLREEDIAARWGGEEFLLLLPDSPDAAIVCERLRASIAEVPVNVHGLLELRVSASFGWAPWSGDETGEALVGRADQALYAAKAARRDQVICADVERLSDAA